MLTDMDQPLGRAVGNALEIREAVATVKGEGPPDFSELVLASAAHLLSLSDLGLDEFTARRVAEEAVADGSALSAYERWIEAQGGDPMRTAFGIRETGSSKTTEAKESIALDMRTEAGRKIAEELVARAARSSAC